MTLSEATRLHQAALEEYRGNPCEETLRQVEETRREMEIKWLEETT